MRILSTLAMALALFTPQAYADGRIELNNVKIIHLEEGTDSKKEIWVSYPGILSGVCGVELRVDSSAGGIRPLLSRLKIEAPFPQRHAPPANRIQIKGRHALAVNFSPKDEAYLGVVVISTVDGSSLADTIKKVYATEDGSVPDVIIVGKSCD